MVSRKLTQIYKQYPCSILSILLYMKLATISKIISCITTIHYIIYTFTLKYLDVIIPFDTLSTDKRIRSQIIIFLYIWSSCCCFDMIF